MVDKIKGLEYIEDYITEDQEAELLEFLDSIEYDNTLSRKTKSFGYQYNYYQFSYTEKCEEIPGVLRSLAPDYNQCIINHYKPGQGIAAHTDNTKIFDDKIIIYSLGSDIEMEFIAKHGRVTKLILKRRSLLVLQGEARYDWKHCIQKRKTDNGIKRGTRYSITFRNVLS